MAVKAAAKKAVVKKESGGYVYIDTLGVACGPYSDAETACYEARDSYDDGEDFEVYELVSAGKFCAVTDIKFIKA